ncbi:MAG: hypothetical protein GF388_09560 [Candidatus Aegiribacteria sp.]|nr:hypothetical protein [Candidatus Aegiribacteria sp.]MBD3295289.1 hypothetical protein [Candidatus Fermentibacteria bacterium]
MSAFLSLLVLCFGFSDTFTVVDVQVPEGWEDDCYSFVEPGRHLVSCSRWNSDLQKYEVMILDHGEGVDTVLVDDERIEEIGSILPASGGGYYITCLEDDKFPQTSAALLTETGTVEWLTPLDLELGGSGAFAELPGGGFVMGGNLHRGSGYRSYHLVLLDGEGSITAELEGDLDEEVGSVEVTDEGLLMVGEMPGSDQTQAFARLFELDGELAWEYRCDPGMFANFRCMDVFDGGYVFGGIYSTEERPMPGIVVEVDDSGSEVWRSSVLPDSGYQQVYINSVMRLDDGSVLGVGYSMADNAPRGTNDALIFLLDSEGNELESEILGIPGQNHEGFFGLHEDSLGEVSVYCQCRGADYEGGRYFLVEL